MDESEIEKRRVADQARWATRSLAGHILRVVAGGGNPYQLHEYAAEFTSAMQAYYEIHRSQPNIVDFLDYQISTWAERDKEWWDKLSLGHHMEHRAEEAAVIAGLRIAADHFLGTNSRGHHHLLQAMNDFRAAQEEQRQEWETKQQRREERLRIERVIRISPDGRPELFNDEYGWKKPREPDDLARTEELLVQMGLQVQQEDRVISFVYAHGPNVVYADPREQGKIEFSIWGEMTGKGRKAHRPRIGAFTLYDRWKDLPGKFQKRLALSG